MSKFQIIILVVFIVFAAIGVFSFATFRGGADVSDIELSIWGREDNFTFNSFLGNFNRNTNQAYNLKYREVESGDFVGSVIEAIAEGRGPDIIILSSENLLRFEDKVVLTPFKSISERDFKTAFFEGGEIFLKEDGILAYPLNVDPLVMYWNRDILQSSGRSLPPKNWSELFPFAQSISEHDDAFNITRSAVALGEYSNVNNAKEIILSLLMQNGNNVIERASGPTSLRVVLQGSDSASAESVLKFYTEFANPSKNIYSWNRALPNSLEFFASGDLALYFGFASELAQIEAKNPNLNFDVAMFPQPSEAEANKVFGRIEGLAVLKSSRNPSVALAAALALVSDDNNLAYSDLKGLPPVKRSLLAQKTGNAFKDLFYDSALISKAFLDPSPEESDKIFQGLVERIVSGRDRISGAIRRAVVEFNALITPQ